MTAGKYTVASCTSDALTLPMAQQYQMMDLVMGAQRQDGYSSKIYKTFTQPIQEVLSSYTQSGGSVLVSGSYIASDMQNDMERNFTQNTLKYQFQSSESVDTLLQVQGMNMECSLFNLPNERTFRRSFSRTFSSTIPLLSSKSAKNAYFWIV